MTVYNVYERALALIDEITDDGTIDAEATAAYEGKAPMLMDILQREIAVSEGITITRIISSVEDELEVSEDSALRILPYGLAAKFALADKDADNYNEFQTNYERLKGRIQATEEDIVDVENVYSGWKR